MHFFSFQRVILKKCLREMKNIHKVFQRYAIQIAKRII